MIESLAWPFVVLVLGSLFIIKREPAKDDKLKAMELKLEKLADDVSKLNLAISMK